MSWSFLTIPVVETAEAAGGVLLLWSLNNSIELVSGCWHIHAEGEKNCFSGEQHKWFFFCHLWRLGTSDYEWYHGLGPGDFTGRQLLKVDAGDGWRSCWEKAKLKVWYQCDSVWRACQCNPLEGKYSPDMHSAEAWEIIKGISDERSVRPCRSRVVFVVFMPLFRIYTEYGHTRRVPMA